MHQSYHNTAPDLILKPCLVTQFTVSIYSPNPIPSPMASKTTITAPTLKELKRVKVR